MVCRMVAVMMSYHGNEHLITGWRLNILTVGSCMILTSTGIHITALQSTMLSMCTMFRKRTLYISPVFVNLADYLHFNSPIFQVAQYQKVSRYGFYWS